MHLIISGNTKTAKVWCVVVVLVFRVCACVGVLGVFSESACSRYHCRHVVAVGSSSEVWWCLEAEGWKVFASLYIRVSVCSCLCVLTTLETGGKAGGSKGEGCNAVLCHVVLCCVVLVCVLSRYTVNRPTCRWTQTPKETREVQGVKDERGDEMRQDMRWSVRKNEHRDGFFENNEFLCRGW